MLSHVYRYPSFCGGDRGPFPTSPYCLGREKSLNCVLPYILPDWHVTRKDGGKMKMISRLLGNAIRYVMRQNRAKMTDRSTIPCYLSRQKGITGWAPESVAGSGSAANGEQDLGLDCDRARQRNPVRSRPTRHENPVRDSRIITADRSTTWTRSRPVFPTRNLGVHGFLWSMHLESMGPRYHRSEAGVDLIAQRRRALSSTSKTGGLGPSGNIFCPPD